MECGDKHIEMLFDVGKSLTKDDVKDLLFLLHNKIPGSEREHISDGIELMSALIDKDLLDGLKSLLSQIKRKDLEARVEKYEHKARNINAAKHSLMWQGLVPDFIETSKCREVEERLRNENLAILTGISASGKSQICIWYATKIRKRTDHTTCKLMCETENDLLTTLRSFLESSKIKFERQQEAKSEYIKHMAKVAASLIENLDGNEKQYLFIFDDVSETTCKVVEPIIHLFHQLKNVKILCSTSYSKFYVQCTEKDVFVKVGGVSQSEVLEFFKDFVKLNNSEEDIQNLAKKMGHLPYGLVLANSYIFSTGMTVNKYKELLSRKDFLRKVEQWMKDTCQEYDKGLVTAQMLAVEKVESSSVHIKSLLRFIPFLHHNEIPLLLLRELLPENIDDRDKDTVIFDLIANVRKYCIGEIESLNEPRIISIHAVTALVLELRLSQEEQESCIKELLCFFCKNINIDCRLHETFKNNFEYLPHASTVALSATEIKRSKETMFLKCALHAAIGVTFRVGGVESLLAEEHLNKAKVLCFQFIDEVDPESYMFTVEERDSMDCMEYIDESKKNVNPSESEETTRFEQRGKTRMKEEREHEKEKHKQNAREKDSKVEKLYQRLVSASKQLPEDFIPDIIMQTKRSIHELEHLRKIAGFTESLKHMEESTQGPMSKELYESLLAKKRSMPRDQLSKVCVVEMMVIILYNNGRNHYYQSRSEHQLSLVCWNELRLAYLLGQLLQNEHPGFLSVQSLITKRNGFMYHCLLDRKKNKGTEKDVVLQTIIDKYNDMLNAKDSNFYGYGIIKISRHQRLHHDAMCLKLLLKCYTTWTANNDNTRNVKHYEDGQKHANKLEELLDDRPMCRWLAVPGFHVQIARFFIKHDIGKAIGHFERAVKLEEEYNLQKLSHFKLQGQFGLIKCFICRETPSDIDEGRKICEKLLRSLHKSHYKRQKAEKYMHDLIAAQGSMTTS